MIAKTVEWVVSFALVTVFTFALIWILGLFGLGFQESVLAYLLLWVMFWDRRYTAQAMREFKKKQTPSKQE